MLIAVLGGYLLALICALFYRKFPRLIGYLSVVGVASMAAYFFTFWGSIHATESQSFAYRWVPSLDVDLVFYLDGLSLFFILLISVFGTLILLYTVGYMKGNPQANRFFAYMLIFMASMLGLVMSGNIIQLYIFWELTSISSYLLIGFNNDQKKARRSAQQALLVTAGGGLALLAGLILISMSVESYNMAEILQADLSQSPHLQAILVLILLGAFTKSAQFPFHFWLPNAMAAPTPVSAFLHSATMVKAGIFLLLRFQPLLSDIAGWSTTLMLVGSFTMVFAAVLSFVQFDIKRILAYITVSALGLMVAAIGIGSDIALKAAFLYLLVHALYKGSLFLVAGNLDHESGTKDIRKLGRLAKKMPWTAAAAVMASFCMAGFPPALGFIAKEKLYEAGLHAPHLGWVVTTASFTASALYVGIAFIIGYGIFFGKKAQSPPKKPHPAPWMMWLPPILMAGTGLFIGILNGWLKTDILNPALSNIIGKATEVDLKFWHGFNWVLVLSLVTYLVGFGVFMFRDKLRRAFSFAGQDYRIAPEHLYFKGLDKLTALSRVASVFFQNGYLRNYIFTIFTFLVVLVGGTYFYMGLTPERIETSLPISYNRLYEFIPLTIMLLGIVMVFYSRSRLNILLSASMLGFGVASVFVFFSAPDVSMTQFLVETITVVLFMLILNRLPQHEAIDSQKRRFSHIILALLFGGLMTLILLNIREVPLESEFKDFYLTQSKPKGKGENVVNVILIDFRALDTLGEITVLGITAIGIVALSSLNIKKKKE